MFLLKSLVAFGLLVGSSLAAPASTAPDVRTSSEKTVIPNQYIGQLTSDMSDNDFNQALTAIRGVLGTTGEFRKSFKFAKFRGFSFEAPEATIDLIKAVPGVMLIEPNYNHLTPSQGAPLQRQDLTGYGLDRISHRTTAASTRRPLEYDYNSPAGQGTTIYVLDTGIRPTTADLRSRIIESVNLADDNTLAGHPPRADDDYCNHGTPAAAMAAGSLYGVANLANVFDVRMFSDSCRASYETFAEAIEYAANEIERRGEQATSVINFSAGGPDTNNPSEGVLRNAVQSTIDAGIFMAVSAGNDRRNAQYYIPANVPDVCTVGATDMQDREAYFSNYGALIDIFAPGENLTLPSNVTDYSTGQISGTSFSAPMVAGVAALLKSFGREYSTYDPVQLCRFMADEGTKNSITFTSIPNGEYGGPNVILYDLSGLY